MTNDDRDKLIIQIARDVDVIKNNQERDYHTLYGDRNHDGLVKDVANAQDDIKELQRIHDTHRSVAWTILKCLGTIASGGAIGWLASFLTRITG